MNPSDTSAITEKEKQGLGEPFFLYKFFLMVRFKLPHQNVKTLFYRIPDQIQVP